MAAWIEQVNSLGVLVVGMALGLELRSRNSLSPCPACGAEHRGEKRRDLRGPIGTGDGAGWCCWACSAKGGAVDLVSLKAFGSQLGPGDERWKALRERCSDLGLLGTRPAAAALAPAKLERQVPPPWEVDAVWQSCTPVAGDREVSKWLVSRRLDLTRLDKLDLVRALSRSPSPEWLKRGERTWWEARQRFRAIVPLWNAKGELASLHARAVAPGKWAVQDKATSPRGFSTAGLVIANAIGREIIAGVSRYETDCAKVVIAEGVPDFLTLASSYPTAGVIGVLSGSWNAELAVHIPTGKPKRRVLIATDQDQDGEKYARAIVKSLAGCAVGRWRAKGDVNEVGFAAGTVEEVA